ncbi:MAG: formimidoylglutamate deiminase [Nocardioides sp.]|uniref:formimidoylglutamate deiminase n=1 Tax=Nocardioides sp. TaxID=35761 RepID=UPI00261F0212|nr:formimidoylglutamate deiminase [Nocardioides sp.]MCW2833831.1 formimidoylglutamate deiminase [Nocardioides sp.]
MTSYLLERALLAGAAHDNVLVDVVDGRFASVEVGVLASAAERVPGLTLPGLANTHSHAFHRALRGRTQRGRGTFWTWREQMYAVAERLDPDTYLALATATFREMVAAGITSVGEFHYLHHQPDGRPYDDPNAMGIALLEAASVAGLRITLLDTVYLSSGFGAPPEGAQRRYDDGSVQDWIERIAALPSTESALVSGALHSVRALPEAPAAALDPLAEWAHGRPLHVHLSEQVAENDGCLAAYGASPTRLLADHGVLGPLTSAVHATHLSDDDISLLGEARAFVSFCPTTERDLGDGVGPSRRLAEAGARLTLGSDSHAVVDLFEEMRAVELDERLVTQQRGHWQAAELVRAATVSGHASLGWHDAGEIAVGRRADLVTIDTVSTRTAGTGADEHTAVFAAVAEDVTRTMVDGRIVFRQGEREEIGRALAQAIGKVHT